MLAVGFFNLWTAIGLLLIYSVYVIMVVCQSKKSGIEDEDDIEDDIKASKFHELVSV